MQHENTKINSTDKIIGNFHSVLTTMELLNRHRNHQLKFLIEPIVPLGGCSFIAAERGTGKTRIGISLAYKIITASENTASENTDSENTASENYLGYQINNGGGSVMYLNLEMLEPDFKLILEPIYNHYRSKGVNFKHEFVSISAKSYNVVTLDWLYSQITEFKPTLLIIDSFKALTSIFLREEKEKELTNLNVNALYKHLDKWRKDTDCTILIMNHTNKGTKGERSHSDLMYGAGAVADFADHITLMRKTKYDNQRLIIPDKCRYIKEGAFGANLIEIESNDEGSELWFNLLKEDVSERDYMYTKDSDNNNDENKALVLKYHKEGKSYRAIAKLIGIGKSTVERWIKSNKQIE